LACKVIFGIAPILFIKGAGEKVHRKKGKTTMLLKPLGAWAAIALIGLVDGKLFAVSLVLASAAVLLGMGVYYQFKDRIRKPEGAAQSRRLVQRYDPAMQILFEQARIMEFLSNGAKAFSEIRRHQYKILESETTAKTTCDMLEDLEQKGLVEQGRVTGEFWLTPLGKWLVGGGHIVTP